MRRVIVGALVFLACFSVAAGVAASDLDALWMSLTPGGAAQTNFPSGTETLYAVFEYTDFVSENVRVVVSDYAGTVIFEETQTFSGSGVASIPITRDASAFPDGPYVTTLYFAGQYLTQAVEWTVGGVDSPPTPTAFPTAHLEVEPTALTFSMQQGGTNPLTQRVLISNSTASASLWRATADTSWLHLVPVGGETPALLRVSVDGRGLPAGAYTGHVRIDADEIAGSPQTVDVTFTISPPEGMTTLDLSTVASGTGWVVSDEVPGNHFGDDEIRVGLQAGREYLGGLQFDLSEVPDGVNVQAAAVTLPGLRWEAQPPAGDWILELLGGDSVEEWAGYSYADLVDAASVVALRPDHGVDNLTPGSESVWHFDTSGLDILESLIRDNDFGVLRLRYAPAPAQPSESGADAEDALFVWGAAGILRVSFEPAAEPTVAVTPTASMPAQTPTTVSPPATPVAPPPGDRQPIWVKATDLAWILALFGGLTAITRWFTETS